METIITAAIFSVPGVIFNYIKNRIYPNALEEKKDYEKTISAIVISSIILILNIGILNIISRREINSFNELINNLYYISFFTKYIILSIIVSIPLVIIKVKWFDKSINYLINTLRGVEGKTSETTFPTLWDELFENPEDPIENTFITIEKDGKIITQGQIVRYSPPNNKIKEFILTDVEEIKEYIEADKTLSINEKLLDKVVKQYVNLDTGLTIKFYDNEKLLDYLNS